MNGKLKPFQKGKLDIGDFPSYVNKIFPDAKKTLLSKGKYKNDVDLLDMLKTEYERVIKDEIWINDEYQVNIDKSMRAFDGLMVMWHLSIKRKDKDPIHDWRDLQAIKNMLVGEEYEAVELYPKESRVVDTANQFHLWVLISYEGTTEIPSFPFGFKEGNKSSESFTGGKQRKL